MRVAAVWSCKAWLLYPAAVQQMIREDYQHFSKGGG
jgi:hypothetical protein